MFALRITETLSKLLKILAMTTLSKALPIFQEVAHDNCTGQLL